jgi:hypothetical protein
MVENLCRTINSSCSVIDWTRNRVEFPAIRAVIIQVCGAWHGTHDLLDASPRALRKRHDGQFGESRRLIGSSPHLVSHQPRLTVDLLRLPATVPLPMPYLLHLAAPQRKFHQPVKKRSPLP